MDNIQTDQVESVKNLLSKMSLSQQSHIYSFLEPLLKRDFISYLPYYIVEKILEYLDAKSLCSAELVSVDWYNVISEGKLWKKLIDRQVCTNSLWKGIWERYPGTPPYKSLYAKMAQEAENVDANWRCGRYQLRRIYSDHMICCMQYDRDKIVVGLGDNKIKIFNRHTFKLEKQLTGHTGSVLCLQYDDRFLISGSSDFTVKVWVGGKLENTLTPHIGSVLKLRFKNNMLVTCAKDHVIAIWDIISPAEIILNNIIIGHDSAVTAIDFDDRYIVSASSDRTIKVWNAVSPYESVRQLSGHRRGVTCLQYTYQFVVSGSSDKTIRIWNVESEACLRILEGHRNLIRCIKFDGKRIISGSFDKTIKVWDMTAALDFQRTGGTLCLYTLAEHSRKISELGFDDFEIVSCSQDGIILIWDFWSH